jgi:hypothetical protein
MRTILFVSACLFSLVIAGCGTSGGSGTGGTSSGGAGGSGGGTTTSSGGAGGSGGGTTGTTTTTDTGTTSTTGTTSSTTTTSTSGGKAAFGEACTMDTDCVDGLVCFNFNAKGMLCTKKCSAAADCPAPSSGCNGMGYCKPN